MENVVWKVPETLFLGQYMEITRLLLRVILL